MKKTLKKIGIIAMAAMIVFSFAVCDSGGGGDPALSGNIVIKVNGAAVTTADIGATLTADYDGSETVTYQWKRGTTNLGTASTQAADEAGSYTVTVSAAGFQSKTSSPVTVTSGGGGTHSITLTQGGSPLTTHDFPSAIEGYGQQTALTVTVTNTGTEATGPLSVVLSGANQNDFTLSTTLFINIPVGNSLTFTVRPNTGLAANANPYTATVIVSGGNGINESFTVSFTVTSGGGGTVETPTATPPTGTYDSAQSVTLSTTTAGATIYYTTQSHSDTGWCGKRYI